MTDDLPDWRHRLGARDEAIAAFLAQHGYGGWTRIDLGGDASTRRYERLVNGDRTLILMDAPPKADLVVEGSICTPNMSDAERRKNGYTAMRRLAGSRVDAFVCINGWLEQNGFSVPHVHAFDVAHGFAVLEDLGDGQYGQLLAQGDAPERALYEAAVDALIRLDQLEPPAVLTFEGVEWPLLSFDSLVVLTEAEMFPEWYIEREHGIVLPTDAMSAYYAAWRQIDEILQSRHDRLVTRDYHSPNLLWLPEREGYKRAGILDHQDAVLSHPAFNLMFLLNDPRRDVPAELQQAMLDRYFAGTAKDRADFMRHYAAIQALQAFRIAGLFCRLKIRDGKPVYMPHVPRLERYIRQSLTNPACAPINDWLRTYAPQLGLHFD